MRIRDRTDDLHAIAEEPVVCKHAHIVEEIRVHKDRTERVHQIPDTLRHTDVQLSDLPGERRVRRLAVSRSLPQGLW